MKMFYPSVGFPKQVERAVVEKSLSIQTFSYTNSGNLTGSVSGALIGTSAISGEVSDLVLSVGDQGRDDTDALSLEADLKLNGSSIMSTNPTVEGASGEAGTATVGSDPAFSSHSVNRGDRFTLDLNLTRTTPDTEMSDINVAVVIKKV